MEGGQEVLGGRLLDDLGKAGEAGGGLGLAFLVVFGGEAELGGEAGADQHGQHASADFLEEFATMRLRHGTPPHGSSDGNRWPILPRTPARYTDSTAWVFPRAGGATALEKHHLVAPGGPRPDAA